MYFNISQEKYRKYSKKFKKTFIGKSRYRDYLGCSILNIYFTIILALEFIIGIIKNIKIEINFYNIILILLVIIFTSLNIITRAVYDNNLKEYIISCMKNEIWGDEEDVWIYKKRN